MMHHSIHSITPSITHSNAGTWLNYISDYICFGFHNEISASWSFFEEKLPVGKILSRTPIAIFPFFLSFWNIHCAFWRYGTTMKRLITTRYLYKPRSALLPITLLFTVISIAKCAILSRDVKLYWWNKKGMHNSSRKSKSSGERNENCLGFCT